MDRLETDATADSNGMVHIHVGSPGRQVHVVVDTPVAALPGAKRAAAFAELAAWLSANGATMDPELVSELKHAGHNV